MSNLVLATVIATHAPLTLLECMGKLWRKESGLSLSLFSCVLLYATQCHSDTNIDYSFTVSSDSGSCEFQHLEFLPRCCPLQLVLEIDT